MTIRPIMFSAPMIRAALEGRKTQTRRVLRGAWQQALSGHDKVKTFFAPPNVPQGGIENVWAPSGIWAEKHGARGYNRHLGFSPYRPGDLLYVRESHYVWSSGNKDRSDLCINYRATEPDAPCTWTPSIHMPRWASRLTLEVTEVRVQRLNEISDADAIAEGVRVLPLQDPCDPSAWWEVEPGKHQARTPSESFARLWDGINGPGAWDLNPWVVAVTFTVHKCNVDHFADPGKKVAA